MNRSGSLRIAHIGGVAIDMHWSFGLVLSWGAWQGWVSYGSLGGAGYGMLTISLLFVAVLLHELGHALTARGFGLVVRQITLLPIGGMAELETIPNQPIQELTIALAGPMINLALATVLAGVSWLLEPYVLLSWRNSLLLIAPPGPIALLHYLLWVNVVLFFFNMLPAFPMDGGRIVRAALALWFNYEVGTRLAAILGRLFAIGIALLGAVGYFLPEYTPNPLLVVVGLVVYFGAQQEERAVRRRRALVRLEVQDVSREAREIVTPSQPLTRGLIARMLQEDLILPVVRDDGQVVGLLMYRDVQQIARRGVPPTVAHAMRPDFPSISPLDTLWVALREMTAHELDTLPVLYQGRLVGLVTLDDLNRAWRFSTRQRQER